MACLKAADAKILEYLYEQAEEPGRPRPLLPREKAKAALRALLAATGARDPASLATAVAELEDAVHGLRRAANSLTVLGPEGAAGRKRP